MSRRSGKIAGPLANLSLIAVSLFFCVGVMELAIRALGLDPGSGPKPGEGLAKIIEFDPEFETRYRPGAETAIVSPQGEFDVIYRTNALGLRDRPLAPKARDEWRVLVLGNSFVEGWGIELDRTFLRVAEARLASRPELLPSGKKTVRLVGAGVSGFGAAQSLLFARRIADAAEPDAIVFVFLPTMAYADRGFLSRASLGLDGIATGLDPAAFLSATPAAAKSAADIPGAIRRLAEHSALLRLAVGRIDNAAAQSAIVPGDPATDLFAAIRAGGRTSEVLAPSFKHVAAMNGFAAARSNVFAMVYLPVAPQVSAVEWDRGRVAYGVPAEIAEQGDRVAAEAFCRAERIECRFAAGALSAAAAQNPDSQRAFFRFDFHINERGSAALGEWLASVLPTIAR